MLSIARRYDNRSLSHVRAEIPRICPRHELRRPTPNPDDFGECLDCESAAAGARQLRAEVHLHPSSDEIAMEECRVMRV